MIGVSAPDNLGLNVCRFLPSSTRGYGTRDAFQMLSKWGWQSKPRGLGVPYDPNEFYKWMVALNSVLFADFT